jgi:hypothetical protein
MYRLAGERSAGGGSESDDEGELPELTGEQDSDSDSDGGDLTVTPNAFELVSRDDVSHC